MTDDEIDRIAAVLNCGCPLETAADMVSVALAHIEQLAATDPLFDRRARRAAAMVEVGHMQNVKTASSDSKNWRASVWWLEHCRPNKYGRRPPDAIPATQFRDLVGMLEQTFRDEVLVECDRERLVGRLKQILTDGSTTPSQAPEEDHHADHE